MSTTVKAKAAPAVLKKRQARKARSLSEAGRVGRCVELCNSLDIKDFEFVGLAKLVDLRPALGEGECLVIKLRDPEYFLVVSKREAVLSPLLNLGDNILWAFEEEASKYVNKPEIMVRSDISVLNIRAERYDNVINKRSC
jgi:hypothetical protein